jgi:hypothetical protein
MITTTCLILWMSAVVTALDGPDAVDLLDVVLGDAPPPPPDPHAVAITASVEAIATIRPQVLMAGIVTPSCEVNMMEL